MSKQVKDPLPVTIAKGLVSWQVLQQDDNGCATVTLSGTWGTVCRREKPEVRVRICREDSFTAIGRAFDRARARTRVDRSLRGENVGKRGTWKVTLKDIPCGGPYRIETSVGSADDAIEWRREGQTLHFVGVGDVWLIAGQSNAEGYGRSPAEDAPEIGLHQFSDNGWEIATHCSRQHPWLAFARILKKDLGFPIGLIPTAVGGTPISRWVPGKGGDLFARMKSYLAQAGGGVRGVLWYQGESDAQPDLCRKYKAQFTRYAKGVRRIAGNTELPIITVQLNRVFGDGHCKRSWEGIREVQRQLSHELPQVYLLSAFDSVLSDGIHNGSLGNLLIGQRAAEIALGGVYGRDMAFRHPECSSVRKVNKATLELVFDHVVYRLDQGTDLQGGAPFRVCDEQGELTIAALSLVSRNRIQLKLNRGLIGKATVTGAPGTCPPHSLPCDMNGYRPMLGFTKTLR